LRKRWLDFGIVRQIKSKEYYISSAAERRNRSWEDGLPRSGASLSQDLPEAIHFIEIQHIVCSIGGNRTLNPKIQNLMYYVHVRHIATQETK